jgi:hypothetical protein
MLELTSVNSSEVMFSLASIKLGREYLFLLSQMYFKKSLAMIVFSLAMIVFCIKVTAYEKKCSLKLLFSKEEKM